MNQRRIGLMMACLAAAQFAVAWPALAETKAFFKVESGGHTAPIKEVIVTANQRYLISAADDKSIRVWDTASNREVRKILGQIGAGSNGMIHAMALSPDDRYLAVAVHRGETYNKGPDDGLDRIRLYDFKSGTILAVVDPSNSDDVVSLAFSEDGKLLASGSEDHSIKVWSVEAILSSPSATPLHVISGDGEARFERPYDIEIFKEQGDTRIVLADYSEYMRKALLYSLDQKRFIGSFQDQDRLDTLAVSDHYIAAAGYSEHILVFDRNLRHLKTIPYPTQPKALAFSPDGRLLLAGGIRDMDTSVPVTSTVFDTTAGFASIQTFSKQDARVAAVTFQGNDIAITAGGSRQEIYFWNARSGAELGRIAGVGSTVFAVGLRGSEIGFGNVQAYKDDQNNYASLQQTFDLEAFAVAPLSRERAATFTRARTRWSDQVLLIDPNDQWDLFIRKSSYDYRIWRTGGWYYHEAFGFTDDGYVLSGGRGGEVRAYDNNGRMVSDFVGHTIRVWDLALQRDLLVTGSADQTIRIWNAGEIRSGRSPVRPLLSLFVAQDGEWVIWSESGFYDASLRGDRYIGYHINQGEGQEALYYSSDRFLKALYRPDVIRSILQTRSEAEALRLAQLRGERVEHILPPRIELISEEDITTTSNAVTLRFRVTPREDAVTRVWILRNDQFVWGAQSADVASGGLFEREIELLPGENRMTIFAESRFAKSNPTRVLLQVDDSQWATRGPSTEADLRGRAVKIKEERPNLYILAVGVSDYLNDGRGLEDLMFADNDASAVVAALRTQKGKVYNDVFARLLTNGDATKNSVEAGIAWLQERVREREEYKRKNRVVSRDVTLVFLAGHGLKHAEDFYFMTHDAHRADLANSALKILDQASVITTFPTELVLMTDACHSGEIGGDIIQNIDVRELRKRLVAINERAVVIFSATTSNEPSVENTALGHGVFTKVILDGLKDEDEVYLLQLISFVQRNVKRITKESPAGQQRPTYEQLGQLDDYVVSRR